MIFEVMQPSRMITPPIYHVKGSIILHGHVLNMNFKSLKKNTFVLKYRTLLSFFFIVFYNIPFYNIPTKGCSNNIPLLKKEKINQIMDVKILSWQTPMKFCCKNQYVMESQMMSWMRSLTFVVIDLVLKLCNFYLCCTDTLN